MMWLIFSALCVWALYGRIQEIDQIVKFLANGSKAGCTHWRGEPYMRASHGRRLSLPGSAGAINKTKLNLIFYPAEFVTCSLQLANLSCNNKINFVLINTGLLAVLKKKPYLKYFN